MTVTDAAVARMVAAGAPRVYAAGSVPSSPVYPYSVVSVGSGEPGGYNLAGQHGLKRFRVSVQAFGRTANEVTATLARAEAAFLDQAPTDVVADATRARQDIAVGPERDPDGGGVIYGLVVYVFTA